jgi:hypothetical protein
MEQNAGRERGKLWGGKERKITSEDVMQEK